MNELEHYNKVKEELTQKYNRILNGKILDTPKLMCEYLDDQYILKDCFFTSEEYEILQQELVKL